MTQTLALLLDAYRELNSRKMFWITLGLSLVLVAALACVGINDRGISILAWTIEAPIFTTKQLKPAVFYKTFLFLPVGFDIWLSWASTILALISTASIFPEFISSGSIELTLSKPISRLRLFATKYLTGLLFVALQVGAFSLGTFLVIGIRGHSWETSIFYAVPLMILFFSYLFAVCVLAGMLTRSTVASILLTGLIWLCIFLVHLGEAKILVPLQVTQAARISVIQEDISKRNAAIAKMEAQAPDPGAKPEEPTEEGAPSKDAARLNRIHIATLGVEDKKKRLAEFEKDKRLLDNVHAWFYGAATVLPKTSETMGLLERRLVALADLDEFTQAASRRQGEVDLGEADDVKVDHNKIGRATDEVLRSRSVGWVVGTSLAFEALILGCAAWIFCRRDY